MRAWIKIVGAVFGVVVLAIAGGFAYWGLLLPRKAAPRMQSVIPTPERLARGKYIFEAVADCGGCHSIRDFTRFGGPVVPGGQGKGQTIEEAGLPGRIVAPNITPDLETGIGTWTDGEKIRAIREGIAKDGRVLFPMMPYENFRSMSDEDVESLVAYLDALPPIKNKLPETQVAFPASFLIRSAPQPAGAVKAPPRENTARYGAYLAGIASCVTCHTPGEKGKLIDYLRFSGGRLFQFAGVSVVSANITPDPETGIGSWTEDYFKQRFTLHRAYVEKGSPTIGPEQFTIMPWLGLCQLDSDDLSALYKFLQKQPSIRNKVVTHPAKITRASM
jgi:mono/diheme cytochrome c family protein